MNIYIIFYIIIFLLYSDVHSYNENKEYLIHCYLFKEICYFLSNNFNLFVS